jgi:putative ATP-binding cassette transporter
MIADCVRSRLPTIASLAFTAASCKKRETPFGKPLETDFSARPLQLTVTYSMDGHFDMIPPAHACTGDTSMNLLAFLLSRSRGLLALATLAGIVSGASSSALVSVINTALHQDTFRTGKPLATFSGILLLCVLSRLASQYLLNHLNQGPLLELRMRLCRRVLTSTLRQLEETGMHRLQTMLTDDIPSVSNSLSMLPTIAISAATLIGCLAYLATLSPTIFLFMLGFIIVGGLIYRLPVRLSLKYFQQSRAL